MDSLLDAGISDNEPGNWAPRYLVMNQPLTEFLHLEPQLIVKLSDLGAAFQFSKPPAERSHLHLRVYEDPNAF